jgi:DNA-binding response OmpR family regulator
MSAEVSLISSVRTPDSFIREGDATDVSSRPTRVLVVDDDPSTRHMLRDYLEQYNIRVVSALQSQEVSRQFAAGEPSVVILDRRLGREDGLDLLREIRSRSDVPVIIISGHRCDEIDRAVGLDTGDAACRPSQILRLRRKLETGSIVPRIIQTERGVEYVFTLPVTRCNNASKEADPECCRNDRGAANINGLTEVAGPYRRNQ